MRIKLTIIALLLTGVLSAQVVAPVPYDKKWHMGAGAIAGIWGTFAGNSLNLSAENSLLFGIGASVVAGVGKELMDVSEEIFGHKHPADPMDIAATTLGGVVGAGLTYAALKIFKKQVQFIGYADRVVRIGIQLKF